jgi:hypothetical protein
MADPKQRDKKQTSRRPGPPPDPPDRGPAGEQVEEEPAVERGERIDTGKTIARGGKTTGHVPGATEREP